MELIVLFFLMLTDGSVGAAVGKIGFRCGKIALKADVLSSAERLFLREIVLADLDDIHVFASQVEVSQYQNWGPNSLEDSERFVKQAIYHQAAEDLRKFFDFGVFIKSTTSLIGMVHAEYTAKNVIDIGYSLNSKFWGKGYGTEAAKMLLNMSFHFFGAERVTASADVLNIGSIKVLEKIGMKQIDIRRADVKIGDRWRDSAVFEFKRDEIK